jgi:hypothetical protein
MGTNWFDRWHCCCRVERDLDARCSIGRRTWKDGLGLHKNAGRDEQCSDAKGPLGLDDHVTLPGERLMFCQLDK